METDHSEARIGQVPESPTVQRRPRRKSRTVLLIIGILVVLILATVVWSSYEISKEMPLAQETVTEFMKYVAKNDLEDAYSLASRDFHNEVPKVDFEQQAPARKPLYANFESQEPIAFRFQKNVGAPTAYVYSGEVRYSDGDTGEVDALLVKEGGNLRILSIKVNVSPERFQKFFQSSTSTSKNNQ